MEKWIFLAGIVLAFGALRWTLANLGMDFIKEMIKGCMVTIAFIAILFAVLAIVAAIGY